MAVFNISMILSLLTLLMDITLSSQCLCGIERISHKIIGGRFVKRSRYPWMVGVATTRSPGQRGFCGGSIINNRFVLTARHCVENVPLEHIQVIIGAQTQEDLATFPSHKLAGVFMMESKHDFALLKLLKPLEFDGDNKRSESLSPICLSTSSGPYDNLFLTGWGLTRPPRWGGMPSCCLKEVDLTPVNEMVCQMYWITEFHPLRQMCAGASGSSACLGDSGGPLSTRRDGRVFQVGIVSYGDYECGVGTNRPTVYTKVSAYERIIRTVVNLSDSLDNVRTVWCD